MTTPGDEPVGSVGEEAAKLFGALSDWAGEHVQDLDGHLATGSAECLYCPVCRTVHAVRNASPELKAQLTTAASSLLQAAAGLLAAAGAPDAPPESRVQRIDLDSDLDPDLDDEDTL